jgi:hypothetical protein
VSTIDAPTLFVCDDVHIVTVLTLFGVHHLGIRADGAKRWFKFDDSPYLRETLAAYERGTLTVNPRMYALLYRDLVSQMRKVSQ